MLVPVLVEAKAVEPGDRLVFIDEGVLHERVVHKVSRGSLVMLSGEKFKVDGSVIAVREIEHSVIDLTAEVKDDRDRDDLRQAEAARARCARYKLRDDNDDPLYWTVYHREDEWRQALLARGHELHKEDQ